MNKVRRPKRPRRIGPNAIPVKQRSTEDRGAEPVPLPERNAVTDRYRWAQYALDAQIFRFGSGL